MNLTALIFTFVLIARVGYAQDLDEAKGLGDEPKATPAKITEVDDSFHHRSYLLFGAVWNRGRFAVDEFPNAEASLSADYKIKRTTGFVDGIYDYTRDSDHSRLFLNQIGLRQNLNQHLMVAVGKERNRRSPGIVISPSDLLFSMTNLPGLREDRVGVWLARASYQETHSSYDLYLLPVDQETSGGWPEGNSKYRGSLVRTFQQFDNWDFSLSAGRLQNVNRVGFSTEAIFSNLVKAYAEYGYYSQYTSALKTRSDLSQFLVGLGYEGSTTYGLKAEYFYNGVGYSGAEYELLMRSPRFVSVAPNFFQRKNYAILSASAIEIRDKYNFYLSQISSLDDGASTTLLRTEYLATGRLVLGGMALLNARFDVYDVDAKFTF